MTRIEDRIKAGIKPGFHSFRSSSSLLGSVSSVFRFLERFNPSHSRNGNGTPLPARDDPITLWIVFLVGPSLSPARTRTPP